MTLKSFVITKYTPLKMQSDVTKSSKCKEQIKKFKEENENKNIIIRLWLECW